MDEQEKSKQRNVCVYLYVLSLTLLELGRWHCKIELACLCRYSRNATAAPACTQLMQCRNTQRVTGEFLSQPVFCDVLLPLSPHPCQRKGIQEALGFCFISEKFGRSLAAQAQKLQKGHSLTACVRTARELNYISTRHGEETKEYLLVDHDGVADGSYRQDSLNIQLLNSFSGIEIHCLFWRLRSEYWCCQWRCRKGLANLETFDSSTNNIHWA